MLNRDEPEPRQQGEAVGGWRQPTVVAVAVLAAAAGYSQFGITAVLGDVAQAFGEEASAGAGVGLDLTALGVGLAVIRLAAIGALPAASLADRFGRRRLLLALTTAGVGLTVASAATPGFWWFVAVVAAARPMLSGGDTLVAVVAAERTRSKDRAKALALTVAAYSVGAGIVALLHGAASDVLGFRGVLAAASVWLLVLPVVARHVDEPSLFLAHTQVAPRLRPALLTGDPELRRRLVLVAGLAGAIALVTGPAFTFLFVYGENVLGVAPATMGLLVLAAGPVGLAGLLVGRWAADHGGRRPAAGLAMAGTAVAATLAYSGSPPALAAGYLATVFAGGAFGPPSLALLAELFPTAGRATAKGWGTATGVVGSVVGLLLFGVLADASGSFAVAAALLWLPVAPLAVLYRLVPETRGHELDEVVPHRDGEDGRT